LLSLV